MKKIKKWSSTEDELLIKLFPKTTFAEISKKLGRSEASIKGRGQILRKQGKLPYKLPKIDTTKFSEMWLNNISARLIAEKLGISLGSVHNKRWRLGLPLRGHVEHKIITIKHEKAVLSFLRKKGGYCDYKILKDNVPMNALKRLVSPGRIYKFACNLSRGTGNYKRFSQDRIFRNGFFGKTFICIDRTAMVRIAFDACNTPENQTDAKILSAFLRKHLTHAEKIAVLWRLGRRRWDRRDVKSSIQVDGVVMPRKKWRHLRESQQKTIKNS